MTIASDIQDDFSDVLDEDFNKEVSFGEQTVRCFEATLPIDVIVATAGYQERYRGSLYTPVSDWTTPPKTDDPITFEGEELLVIGTVESGLDVYLRVDYTTKFG